jgi:phospholipase C
VPERTGEPSVFKHVLYIIKENRTYDQVYGDLKQGRGMPALCVFGDSVTPNQHKLALEYSLIDNYHASGKSSAEGHQWTDAGMVSDYIEKNVRAWFRSYPHRQYDAMVYTPNGFIWNHALDRSKSVRIYGEACFNEFDESLKWADIWGKYVRKEPFVFKNTSTISRVRPILSQTYPGYDDPKINDQLRADAFINELKQYEQMPGDSLPQLMIIALPNDHTAGTSPGYPTPRAQVADNDLALGRMMDALTKSRFWDSTVVFVTEDDSQNGWDHISAYRTGALVLSPYSRLGRTVSTNYNQLSMLRTIELILGLPPMHAIDATALPMFDCFTNTKSAVPYTFLPNRVPLNEMNKPLSSLKGKGLNYAKKSLELLEEGVDNGHDDDMNRILWYAMKGNVPYPGR